MVAAAAGSGERGAISRIRVRAAAAATAGLPLDSDASVLTAATFRAMGTSNTVVVDDPGALAPALDAARLVITDIDDTCSRFKMNTELSRLNRGAGGPPGAVSSLLADAIAAALHAACATDGIVDPTVGHLVERIGYTVTFGALPLDGPPLELELRAAPGWDTVAFDRDTRTVSLPDGVALDLGAVGKAWAADRAARASAERTGVGVMMACGGDVAIAGPARDDGWCVRVTEHVGAPEWQDVRVFDGGVATSGTRARSWRRGGHVYHHIVDPATGLPVGSPWSMVTVAAATCAEANAAATAALIRGHDGPDWLAGIGLPARLVAHDGSTVTVGRWPYEPAL